MSQLQEETAARPEMPTGEQAEAQFDEGFELGGEDEGRDTAPAKEPEQPGGEQARPEEQPRADTPQTPPVMPQTSPEQLHDYELKSDPPSAPQAAPEPAPVKTVETPAEIADELETLKTLNPAAAALALEDTPEGASVRARLEQYGPELAQDRAEQVLYRRQQAQARREAEAARYEQAREAHNAAFKAMFERDHPEYAAMLADPDRRAEAVRYQQDVLDWIGAKPYAEAARLMEVARYGRDPAEVSALLAQYKRERGGKPKQPDPTGALAVPGRGAPVAPAGVGDKDDFDAGWNAHP
ncbi:hypothetical protein [Desulfovibrio sp. ZJ200]|uniref:hypothetical protein n=1 Tax=Desulfovibrio sp. ZJ200 TaxID=2709792 RepID=UPI0013ED17B8|nr:hypothetical protein [Desulfovibrio sp. ZJ200]